MHKNILTFSQPVFLLSLLWLACSNSPKVATPLAPEAAQAAAVEVGSPAAPVSVAAVPLPSLTPAVPPKPVSNPKRPNSTTTVPTPTTAPPAATAPAPETATGLHDAWDQLLRRHVSSKGKVNYKGFKADKAALDSYLQALADNPPNDSWSRAEKMAYWINAYNAFTIDLIVDNYPISSILKLDNGKTWDVKRITLGGKKYSLNQIENEILRPQFKDARIHFAINCAAKSCPPLLNKAYTADQLTRTLEQRTRQFINDPAYNSLSAEQASVSKIFEWYAVDFGDLRGYLNKYAGVQLGADATISFGEYDWDIND